MSAGSHQFRKLTATLYAIAASVQMLITHVDVQRTDADGVARRQLLDRRALASGQKDKTANALG